MTAVRVLDAADAHGAFAVEVLAGLGARVERAPLGAAALARADVVVVGRAARDWIARRGAWPRLVWVAVTPFGLDGPRADWAGGELVAQAAGGLVWPNGDPATAPLPLPGAPATRAAGVHAALGVLLALRARRRDGRGRLVDVSVQESATALLEHVAGAWFDGGAPARRRGALHWSGTCRVGRCRDGFALLSHVGDWTALREWLVADGAAGDLAADRWHAVDERCRHAAHVFDVLDAWAARYAVDDLVAQAQLRRLPFAAVADAARVAREAGAAPALRGVALGAPGIAGRPAPQAADLPPLHGVRVVDLTWVVAGPLATRVLADFGAEVIHVTRPDAPPPAGTAAVTLARGKRRRPLDLRAADGLAALRALLRDADVVVDNFSRRVLPNFGLDDDALHAINPRLVIAHLAAFPAGDPRADWVSFAPTLHALGGLTDAMRGADGAPLGPGFAYADTASGWAAALAVVAALDAPGRRLDLAQRDLLAWMLAPPGAAPAAPPAHAVYRCADAEGGDRWCAIPGARDAALAGRVRGQPAVAVVERLQASGTAAAVVATPADLAADPQLGARGWWRRVDGVAHEAIVPRLAR